MILATYQGIDYATWKNDRYSTVKKVLGLPEDTNIYWCFAANNVQQAVINSLCVEANTPQKFVMFETDDYYMVDKIKWNRIVENIDNDNETAIKDAFIVDHMDAVEYLVTSIPEKRFECDVNLFDIIHAHLNDNHPYKKHIDNYLDAFNSCGTAYAGINEEYEHIKFEIIEDGNNNDALAQLAMYKMKFDGSMLPAIWLIAYDYLFDKNPPSENITSIKALHERERSQLQLSLVDLNMNHIHSDDAYSRLKCLYSGMYKTVFITANRKIGPNEKCPCGSGKKYKKCCANASSDTLTQLLTRGIEPSPKHDIMKG
jgi:hypothetical protein